MEKGDFVEMFERGKKQGRGEIDCVMLIFVWELHWDEGVDF